MRYIALDTETTGLSYEEGHRIIEIGCVEIMQLKLTGKNFHYYLNPEREIDDDALAVHGITNDFLVKKPLFRSIIDEFVSFVHGSILIIHNASFDTGFLNHEFRLAEKNIQLADLCEITDTLQLARQKHVGQRNSLDALCKRYRIDNSERERHGALLDATLLAKVWLAMTGGQGSFFDELDLTDFIPATHSSPVQVSLSACANAAPKQLLRVIRASHEELARHQEKYNF